MSPATSTESSARSVVNPLNRSSLTPDVAQRRLKTPRKNQGTRDSVLSSIVFYQSQDTNMILPKIWYFTLFSLNFIF